MKKITENLYQKVRTQLPEEAAVVVLHIAEDYTFLIKGIKVDKAEQVWTLPIGSKVTSTKHFRDFPPTEIEVEKAIMDVEDEVMPLSIEIEKGKYELVSFDPVIHDIAGYANVKDKYMTTAEVEGVFSRLAAIITGRPASMDILPQSNEFASSLLILREVVHHLGFKSITVI